MKPENKTDDLTGLYTRGILSELDKEFSRIRSTSIWSLIIVDIDHFKLVNDVFGHLEGDKVLRRVASILSRNHRGADTLIRYGGDEFLIVLPDTKQFEAVNLAERILECFSREVFSDGMEIGLSLGVAESKRGDKKISDIFARADEALYEAKNSGRGKVSFWQSKKAKNREVKISFEHFVGRNQELTELRDVLASSINKEGNLVVIAGEAGVGKSRLCLELAHYSSFNNCAFIKTKFDEFDRGRPFFHLTQPIQMEALSLQVENSNFLRTALPSVLPQTAELFAGINFSVIDNVKRDNMEIRFRLFSEIFSLLRWVTERKPVVFLIEDLHWMADHDYELFAYLARASSDLPVMFLCTTRLHRDYPELQKKVKVLSSFLVTSFIQLERLTEEQTKHLVLFALRDPKIPKEILDKLVKHSGGNPLFLKELLLTLHGNGSLIEKKESGWNYKLDDEFPLPTTVSELIAGRLKSIKTETMDILCTASLLSGGVFNLEIISSVLEIDEFKVAKALSEPLRLKIIIERVSEANILEYTFIHDTMRCYFVHEFSVGLRKATQFRLGQYYEKIFESGDWSVVSSAAHHYCDSLNSDKAMKFALLAKEEAMVKDAKQEALRWLERYLLFEKTATNKISRIESFNVRLEMVELYILFADRSKAVEFLDKAKQYASNSQEIGLITFQEAELQFNQGNHSKAKSSYGEAIPLLLSDKRKILSEIKIAYILFLSGSDGEAIRLFKSILDKINNVENCTIQKQLLAEYYMKYGDAARGSLPREERTELCLKAIDIYRELRDKIGEARALLSTAVTLGTSNKLEATINILNDALRVLAQTGDIQAIIGVYINLGHTYKNAIEMDLCRDYYEKCLELAKAAGAQRHEVSAECYLGALDSLDFNKPNCEIRLLEAIKRAEKLKLPRISINGKLFYAHMLMEQKRFSDAMVCIDEIERDPIVKHSGVALMRILQGFRGAEKIKNNIYGKDALLEVELFLIEATKNIYEEPSLEAVYLSSTLAECQIALKKIEEAEKSMLTAEKLLEAVAADIDNEHYRENIMNSETPLKLRELKEVILKMKHSPLSEE